MPTDLGQWVETRFLVLEYAYGLPAGTGFTYSDLFAAIGQVAGMKGKTTAQAQAEKLAAEGLLRVAREKPSPKIYEIATPGRAKFRELQQRLGGTPGMPIHQLASELDERAGLARAAGDIATALADQLRELSVRVRS